jgi:penicillin-binding protein 2
VSRSLKVFGALLFGLVLGTGVGANAATGTSTSGKTKRHSAGTTRVATSVKAHSGASHSSSANKGTSHAVAATTVAGRRRHGARPTLAVRRTRYQEHFSASSYADNLTLGDVVEGEDPLVRAAAIEALGNMNGTAIAIDPSTGRILAMVNQKLALSRGAEPCSTIKLTVALAALEEGIVNKDTPVNLGGHYHLTMTEALAHSNNLYFETLGRQLGFERVKHYANEFGLGELAGYQIQGEQLGTYPDEVLPASLGGVGRMCSFGESVSMTPLQLGALVSAIANGGTLYYLQHPETAVDVATFEPKVKRVLDIAPLIPEISVGMQGAVQYGTARSLRANFSQFPVMGKTGTCSNNGTRFGWFGSFADTPKGRIVTVFFLEGGRPTFGPKAAELTGEFYRALWDKDYFQQKPTVETSGVVGASE